VFVGYAAVGTLARQIIDGAKTVRILTKRVFRPR
jgi:predicted metal-dependent RNase